MNSYSLFSQILHNQFLSKNDFTNFLIKRILHKSKEINLESLEYIFITGLARAGTTSLLESISESKGFGSLRYKYMPFTLSPTLAKIYNRHFYKPNFSSSERMHEDGLRISLESAECLDEPYWIQSLFKDNNKEFMEPHTVSKDLAKGYGYILDYFLKIENKERLVIKNNNNHLRLISLSKFFLKSKFLVVFRSPLSQARSLMNVHEKISKKQTQEKFILEYMNLIGHWEFGKGKKPFIYKKEQINILKDINESNLNYWLEQWIYTYEWLLKVISSHKTKNIFLICYEDLCGSEKYESKIFKNLNINLEKKRFKFQLGKSNLLNSNELENSRIKYASEIYNSLREKSFQDNKII